jgi:hypothetical protein
LLRDKPREREKGEREIINIIVKGVKCSKNFRIITLLETNNLLEYLLEMLLIRALVEVFFLFFLSLENKTIFCFHMKIYFTIPSLPFSYSIKILFLYNIQVSNLSLLCHKISAQSSIKDKNMKEGREKRNVYTKIMYKKTTFGSLHIRKYCRNP